MRIRFKDKDGKFRQCECRDRYCSKRKRFSPGCAIHSSPGGCPASGEGEETAQTAEQRSAETETQETK